MKGMWRFLIVIFFFIQTISGEEDSTKICLRESNATTTVFTDNFLVDANVCCTTCDRCTNEDCCGYNSNTRTCYYCTSGTCCGSVSNPDSLGCCDVGRECCLNCGNSTRSDGLVCVEEGSCTCSPLTNSCVDDKCCPSQFVCGDTCCETGTCCNGVCCESGTCCDGECCNDNGKCCYDGYNNANYCCDDSQTCCGGSCCSSTQVCLTEYSWNTEYYCCNADVDFAPQSCSFNSDCPGWLNDDWTCCYGCCCPGNYTCDSKTGQCIYDVRKNIMGPALGIGLGYGLGLGLLVWILWCALPRDSSHYSHKKLFKIMGYVAWTQWLLVIVRIVLYAIYPYTKDFQVAIAALCTGFWLCLIGVMLKNTRYERWLIVYIILFVLNYILNLVCLVQESMNVINEALFFVVLTSTCVVFLIDTVWTVYFVVYVVKQLNPSSSSSQSQPLIQKRNHVDCMDTFKAKATVSPVSSLATEYNLIRQHFYDAWSKGATGDVNIHYILKLKHSGVSSAYRNYKKKVESENEGQANVTQLFHGTKLSANCKIMSSHSLCKNADCSVCGISRKGFKITHSGLHIKFARFGRGIYFAPNSSKANDYNNDKVRAMFYCKVVLGNKYETEHDKNDLTAAPPSYHSVYGKPGARLNFPEVVVYTEHAVKPTHVIIYSVGGIV